MAIDREKLKARLKIAFASELGEHVTTFGDQLLALERETDTARREEAIRVIFRTAHTLKGAARSVEATTVESLCHRLEDALEAVQAGRLAVSPEVTQLLFAATDGAAQAGNRFVSTGENDLAPYRSILEGLEAAAAGRPIPARVVTPITPPRPAPPPVISVTPPPVAPPALPAPPPAAPPVTPVTPSPPATPPAAATAVPAMVRPPAPLPRPAPPPPDTRRSMRLESTRLDRIVDQGHQLKVEERRLRDPAEVLAPLRAILGEWTGETQSARRTRRRTRGPADAGALLSGTDRYLHRLSRELDRIEDRLRGDQAPLGRVVHELVGAIEDACMLPFGESSQGLDRTIRDLAHDTGKEVGLEIEGGEVGLERSVIEVLRGPLRHLVRNAVDHGIEAPAARLARGKPAEGRITLRALTRGGQVEIHVEDDGQGLDLAAIAAHAGRRGIPVPDSPREQARLIFRPGFSTAARVTEVSGRGVGLDVVEVELEKIHGSVEVTWDPGGGTRFVLTVPSRVSSMRALLFKVSGQVFGMVGANIARVVDLGAAQVHEVREQTMARLEGRLVPVHSMGRLLGIGEREADSRRPPALLITSGGKRALVAVDELVAEQEIVVRSLGPRLGALKTVTGATVLPREGIVLVLNAAELLRRAERAASASPAPAAGRSPAAHGLRLVVADDSMTSRMLLKGLLEAEGYRVMDAPDGARAWEILEEHGADGLVSDVEMPRLDGLDLARRVRASSRFAALPVILITSLESPEERARGMEAGATAYLRKSAFDQSQLVEILRGIFQEPES